MYYTTLKVPTGTPTIAHHLCLWFCQLCIIVLLKQLLLRWSVVTSANLTSLIPDLIHSFIALSGNWTIFI